MCNNSGSLRDTAAMIKSAIFMELWLKRNEFSVHKFIEILCWINDWYASGTHTQAIQNSDQFIAFVAAWKANSGVC